MDEDEDVVIAGSQLHDHLLQTVDAECLETMMSGGDRRVNGGVTSGHGSTHVSTTDHGGELDTSRRLTSLIWPDAADKQLEVELSQLLLRSELLVTEDEEFINNYILTETTMEEYRAEMEGGGAGKASIMKDVLLLSGSLAAVAGAVFFFSERTRAAVTAAAVLPTALAAASSVRIGAKVTHCQEVEEFKRMIKNMLSDMKQFKMILRKSLNLIQGMEMMNQGYISFANSFSHQEDKSSSKSSAADESKLSTALCQRSSFISLRRAIYTHAVQMIMVYRHAIEKLMEINPLADHIDMKDHYLAFIDLEKFGIEKEMQDERLSVRQLKDTIQLSLLQQSEYLRRFSLIFCSRVQEEDHLNKTGILRHVKEIISKLRTVSDKMSNVLEYHQALGLVPLHELDQKCVTLKKQQSYDQVKKLLPLRNVYSSLFSTGLHLQNSLLKLRHMEGLFEALEKSKDKETVANFVPNEKQLLDWLQGFQDIQGELNTCITCLDGGVEEMEYMARPSSRSSGGSSSRAMDDASISGASAVSEKNCDVKTIDDKEEIAHMDQVFEAFISHNFSSEALGFEDDFVPRKDSKQSKRVMKELKTVLTDRRKETDVREAKALARQHNIDEDQSVSEDSKDNLSLPKSLVTTNILGLSQETDSDAESIVSDSNTILSPDNGDHAVNGDHGVTNGDHAVNGHDSVSVSSRTLSDSSDSNRSDVEVDKSRRVYNRTTMSTSSYSKNPHRSPYKQRKRLELRSMSTPDIKSLGETESSSPYVSLELLDHEDSDSSDSDSDDSDTQSPQATARLPSVKDDLSSSSSSESSPETRFRKPKSIKRPQSRKMSTKLKECLMKNSQESVNPVPTPNSSSYSYYQRHKEFLLQNVQPVGFDRSLAVDAIAKSRLMRDSSLGAKQTEEHFGATDSD